jgi:hypothetical protein
MSQFSLTKHAIARANQRGVTLEVVNALLTYADVEVPVGSGCTCLRCSRDALEGVDIRDKLGSLAERLRGLRAIVADDNGQLVTLFHDHGNSRRYRRTRH